MISAALQPKMRVAESFHERIVPSSDLPTMALSLDCTIAARKAAAPGPEVSASVSAAVPVRARLV